MANESERLELLKDFHRQQLPLNDIVRYCSEGILVDFIQQTLQGSGNLHGYRWMYERCLSNGI